MFLRGMLEADAIPVLERVLAFTEKRHQVLAANVANAETPDWRRQDLRVDRFEKLLAEAMARREKRPGRFEMRDDGAAPSIDRGPFVSRRSHAGMLRHDGNNVDLDREMALLARNGQHHNTVAAFLRQKYASLRAALQDRGSAG